VFRVPLRSRSANRETTIRPLLIDEKHEAPAGATCGKIRLPSTAGSAYLKAERKSVRKGSPPKIRLRWRDSEKGRTVALPVGEYRVISYCFYRTDKQGRQWAAAGSSAEGCTELTISRDDSECQSRVTGLSSIPAGS
jgi:hypothetical protein